MRIVYIIIKLSDDEFIVVSHTHIGTYIYAQILSDSESDTRYRDTGASTMLGFSFVFFKYYNL